MTFQAPLRVNSKWLIDTAQASTARVTVGDHDAVSDRLHF
jgi:hypothetical protein